MSFDITRSSLFSTTLYCALLVALFWWGGSIGGAVANGNTAMWGTSWDPLYFFYTSYPLLNRFFSALMVFVCSILVAKIAIRNVIFLERTYMPSVIFVIVSSSFYNTDNSLATILALWLIILSTRQLLRSYVFKRLVAGLFFVAGVYFGAAVLLFPPVLYLSPMIFVALAMFRIGSTKEWLAAIAGFVLPAAFYIYGVWLFGGDWMGDIRAFTDAITLSDGTTRNMLHLNIVQYAFAATLATLVVLSIVRFLRRRGDYKRRSTLCYGFFTLMLFWGVAVMLVSPVRTLYFAPLLAFPLSVLIPNYFAAHKASFLSNFLYAMLLMTAIAIHLVH